MLRLLTIYGCLLIGSATVSTAQQNIRPATRENVIISSGQTLSSNNYSTLRNDNYLQMNAMTGSNDYVNMERPTERTLAIKSNNASNEYSNMRASDNRLTDNKAFINGSFPTSNYNQYPTSTSNRYIHPGGGTVGARYNRINRKYYYYCTSEYSREKCHHFSHGEQKTICGIDPNLENNYANFPGGMSPFALLRLNMNSNWYRDAMLLPDNSTKYSNSSQFFSFDGFIVYENDTIPGIVTITQHEVALERAATTSGRKNYNAMLDDRALSAIVVYKGPKTLHMVRLSPNDKHLSRLVHNGKLTLYDKSYSFLTSNNVDNRIIAVNPTDGSRKKVKVGNELSELINEIYGANTAPMSISKPELIKFINRLD